MCAVMLLDRVEEFAGDLSRLAVSNTGDGLQEKGTDHSPVEFRGCAVNGK